MAWDKGFDFRGTSGYVTDPTNCTYVLGSEPYPTTRNSSTFGFTGSPYGACADASNAVDARLAGVAYQSASNYFTFRVDLPATGDYEIRMAIGQAGAYVSQITVELFDNTTSLGKIVDNGDLVANSRFFDASGTLRTSASDWVNNNASITKTFNDANKILNLKVGPNSGYCIFAHLFISQVTAAGIAVPVVMRQYRQRRA